MTEQGAPSDGQTPPGPAQTPPSPVHFSARTRLRRSDALRIGVVIGSLVVLVATAAVTIGASPSTSAGPAGASPAATDEHKGPSLGGGPGSWFRGPGPFGGPGAFGGPGGFGGMIKGGGPGGRGFGRPITITKIDGSNVSLQTDDGWTRTIAVTATTQIRIGSQPGTLTDLKVGDVVGLNETKNADGTYAITLIVVSVPTVAGTVTDVTASGFTIKLRDGSSRTVTTSSATSFLLGAAKSSKADLSIGARVQVEGADGAGTSFAATVVHIVPDVRAGKVTATTSTTITIAGPGNSTVTIHVDASTTYRVQGATTAKQSDVTVGMYIMAQGISRADGSLDATSVFAGALRGPKTIPVRPDSSPSPTT